MIALKKTTPLAGGPCMGARRLEFFYSPVGDKFWKPSKQGHKYQQQRARSAQFNLSHCLYI